MLHVRGTRFHRYSLTKTDYLKMECEVRNMRLTLRGLSALRKQTGCRGIGPVGSSANSKRYLNRT